MISDETEDSRDIKHNFCVNVQHRRKGWFYFRPLSQLWKNHRTFFCFPPLLFSSQLSSADKVTAAGSGWVLLEKPNVATSILDCQLSRQAAFHCGAPFALWWPWPITRCGENSLMSCLTSWGRCMEENNSYTMEDLISDVKVGSCLSSFDALPTVCMCVSICVGVCPWVRQVLIIQFPKSVTSSLFLGQGSPRVCHSVLCLSMGSLWGGCDDASGPVLVQVMTSDGFRKLQSLPLGGAIPSAASPEEAETLQHR